MAYQPRFQKQPDDAQPVQRPAAQPGGENRRPPVRPDVPRRAEPGREQPRRTAPRQDGTPRPRPAATADAAQRPTTSGEPRRRPAASGEMRQRPTASAETRQRPAASGNRPRPEGYTAQRPVQRRRRRRRKNYLRPVIIGAAALLLLILVISLVRCSNTPDEEVVPTETETEPVPELVHQIATATITSTGDILMHKPVINAYQTSSGYDFSPMLRYVREYATNADYAVANLETTLCGTSNGYQYSGYPTFNCPDQIVPDMKDAGFDMFLTANNHCYDTSMVGYTRTIDVIHQNGMDNLGTMATADDPKYVIKDLNGIKVGMLCYTYEQPVENPEPGIVYLNFIPMAPGSDKLINSFLPSNPEPFYQEVEGYIREMKQKGAEAIVMYMHWGIENQLNANGEQRTMAQKLCDLGVDVIIGGHPHVVQPMDLLTSTVDPGHRTVCLYSMGNAVSNQRLGKLNDIKTAHTEDGVLFNVTFSKYSDNTVYVDSVELIPCWVNALDGIGNLVTDPSNAVLIFDYVILPLDGTIQDQWQNKYDLSRESLASAQASYTRTMDIVGPGLSSVQGYLTSAKDARDTAYQEEYDALVSDTEE